MSIDTAEFVTEDAICKGAVIGRKQTFVIVVAVLTAKRAVECAKRENSGVWTNIKLH